MIIKFIISSTEMFWLPTLGVLVLKIIFELGFAQLLKWCFMVHKLWIKVQFTNVVHNLSAEKGKSLLNPAEDQDR